MYVPRERRKTESNITIYVADYEKRLRVSPPFSSCKYVSEENLLASTRREKLVRLLDAADEDASGTRRQLAMRIVECDYYGNARDKAEESLRFPQDFFRLDNEDGRFLESSPHRQCVRQVLSRHEKTLEDLKRSTDVLGQWRRVPLFGGLGYAEECEIGGKRVLTPRPRGP